MTARDAWGQVAHDLRALADSIDRAIESTPEREPVQQPAANGIPLGACPVHRTAWTVKAGGISKNGKPYPAFYKCSGKNDDGTYCDQRPTKAWADSHPIPVEVVA